jgi:hypothetical protein
MKTYISKYERGVLKIKNAAEKKRTLIQINQKTEL